MRRIFLWLMAVQFATSGVLAAPRVTLSFAEAVRPAAVDGRLVLVVSESAHGEPRFQVGWSLNTAQIFGMDVEGWKPGERVALAAAAVGHPLPSLSDLPSGSYRVQAVLNVYETFRRADGHVLKLPADDGEGQAWNRSPGNLYSSTVEVDLRDGAEVHVELDQVIAPVEPPEDTKYIRHVSMKSELLSAFWGRPVEIGAAVLVPEGFDDEPDARYPVVYNQGHFSSTIRFFSEMPPGPGAGRNGGAVMAHEFYQHWTSGRMPKMLVVLTRHATPFYDDSYGVNSANTGPYGDALVREFYPFLENEFRAVGAPWARVLIGGSTGGWISLAQQIFYPEFFGGAWGLCPDPLDFHAFQLVDLYQDENAYHDAGAFKRLPKPLGRHPDGRLFATMEDFDRQEEALGSRGRSGGQWDAFQATFGPVGPDGYPAPLWKTLTGEIDPEVARHWRDHYDLTALLKRDWSELGQSLVGKLHMTMGTKDTFYLDGAAYLFEEFLESTAEPGAGPYYAGSVTYGDNEPHCYTGAPDVAGLSWHRHMLGKLAEHMRANAPDDAPLDWAD